MRDQIIDRVASRIGNEFNELRKEKVEEAKTAKTDVQKNYEEHIEKLNQKVWDAISEHDEAKNNASKVMQDLLEDFKSKVNEIIGEDDGSPLSDIKDMVKYIEQHQEDWNQFVKDQTDIIEQFFSDYRINKFGDLQDAGWE